MTEKHQKIQIFDPPMCCSTGVCGPSIDPNLVRGLELVTIGAAIASNCETCFKYHLAKAQKLGVSNDDIILAVDIANDVKSVPARSIMNYARRLLSVDNGASQASLCCSPTEGKGNNKKSCC